MTRTFPSVAAALAVSALTAGALAACSSGAGGATLPRTPANVAVCTVLAQVVAGHAPPVALIGATIETNAPITHQLRQDLAQYAADAAQPGASGTDQAKATAERDCQGL